MKHPDVRAKVEALGFNRWTESPEYFSALIKSKYDKYDKVARRGRIAEASTMRSFPADFAEGPGGGIQPRFLSPLARSLRSGAH